MKMKMKMKNRSDRYDINRPRSRQEHKYSKYKKCLTIMILIYIRQHLRNTGTLLRNTDEAELKKALLIKK